MSNEITQFKYEQLDGETADFLRTKESNIRQIVGKAYTELGKELYEARERLAGNNQYDGVFEKWFTHLGWKKRTVYELINRHEELVRLSHEQKTIFEELPVTLTYAISAKSSENTPAKKQAKKEVLSGEITTGKDYHARIKELELKFKQAEQRANVEQQVREKLEEQVEELTEREQRAKQDAQSAREELQRALEESNPFSDEPYGVKLGLALYDAFDELSKWQKEYSWVLTDKTEFQKLVEADPNFAREFNRLDKFWQQMSAAFNGVRSKGTYREESETAEIIDVEFSEVI